MTDYVRWIRDRVGQDPILLNFAAAFIFDDQGRVLLQRRSDDGCWGFPGGAMEVGESITQTVVREVAEETGLVVRVDSLHGVYSDYQHKYPNGDIAQTVTTFVRASIVGGRLSSDEETLDLRYCVVDAAPPGPMTNQLHADALADLRDGRTGVLR